MILTKVVFNVVCFLSCGKGGGEYKGYCGYIWDPVM